MKSILILGGCGYIGSKLFLILDSLGYSVSTIDLELNGNYVNLNNIRQDVSDITAEDLEEHDVIINFAAHSSVAMANNRKREALEDGIVNFFDLLQKVGSKKFIYASSSSVYNGLTQTEANEESDSFSVSNLYDLTKLFADKLAKLYSDRFYALRFGTVCGHSPNLRTDVMINKMVHSAINEGKIVIYNKNINRPILGIRDLCNAILCLIKRDGEPGFYNLASLNATIMEIGSSVAEIMDVPLVDMGETDTYDFKISSDKFCRTYDFEFREDIQSIVEDIKQNWDAKQQGVRI